jgi:hypothetical protein
LPVTWQGWAMHALLLAGGIGLLVIAVNDDRAVVVSATAFALELTGLGAVFTWVASKRA